MLKATQRFLKHSLLGDTLGVGSITWCDGETAAERDVQRLRHHACIIYYTRMFHAIDVFPFCLVALVVIFVAVLFFPLLHSQQPTDR